MPDPSVSLITQAEPIRQRAIFYGYVSTVKPAPSTQESTAWVIAPEHSTTVPVGPCKFGAIHGSTLPAQGAACVVAFDDREVPTIIWWEGKYKEQGGGAGGAVESVFGRIGKVVAKAGDYSVGEVTNAASKAEVTTEKERAETKEGELNTKDGELNTKVGNIESGTTDLTSYLRLLGRAGGQKAIGGTAASNALELESTSNATKGKITIGSWAAFNEESGASAPKRFGIGTATPSAQFTLTGEQPAEIAGTPGTVPANVFTITGAKGGNTSIATTGSGGRGAEGIITAGEGGESPSAATFSGGGAGGKLEFLGGKGGKANAIATEARAGGNGGNLTFKAGAGATSVTASEKNTGGNGGKLVFTAGAGALAEKATVENKGGTGGAVEFTAGTGGGGKNTEGEGGAGGRFSAIAGNGGVGSTAAKGGAGGEVAFFAGGGKGKGAGGAVSFRGGTSEEGTGGTITFETGNGTTSAIMQLTAGAAIGFYGATPATRFKAIAAVTAPGAFKKGGQGFESEAEAKAVIEKLEAMTTAVNELREAVKKIGVTE